MTVKVTADSEGSRDTVDELEGGHGGMRDEGDGGQDGTENMGDNLGDRSICSYYNSW
jgi:hypothetical protein